MSDYRGQHTAPDAGYGAPLHDVEAMMPDYYQHPEYYETGAGEEVDGPSRRAILRSKGNPDAPVWMWRAVPAGVHSFNPGDWVTTSKPYARQHMEGEDGWHVIARRVQARNLYSEGNSINEWGYWPMESDKGELSLDEWANLISLYHFTTPKAARAIIETRKWVTAEDTGEVWGSTRKDGQATGYGTAYVHVIMPKACATLDEEFPDGEEHYRFLPADAFIATATPKEGLTQPDW